MIHHNLRLVCVQRTISISCTLGLTCGLTYESDIMIIFIVYFFLWSIVDLQCFINFYCAAKQLSYTHICILFFFFFLDYFPLCFIPGYWIYFFVLYSRTLLFIHSLYSFFLLILNSQSIPLSPALPPGNHKSVLYVYESVL